MLKNFKKVIGVIEEKWMRVAERFNTNAKAAGITARWGAKTVWRPFWWVGIVVISYFLAMILTGSEFNLEYLLERMVIGFFAYCIGMYIQWVYVRSARLKKM